MSRREGRPEPCPLLQPLCQEGMVGGEVGKNMCWEKKDPDLEASAEGDGVTEGLEGKEMGLGKSQGRITCGSVERQRPVSGAEV